MVINIFSITPFLSHFPYAVQDLYLQVHLFQNQSYHFHYELKEHTHFLTLKNQSSLLDVDQDIYQWHRHQYFHSFLPTHTIHHYLILNYHINDLFRIRTYRTYDNNNTRYQTEYETVVENKTAGVLYDITSQIRQQKRTKQTGVSCAHQLTDL
ncbi:hypothetical protein J6590_016194 [Homalodisca vitripennis]|nr:hypothetical protein J6590_016194 [Homalodisca vitripennis]